MLYGERLKSLEFGAFFRFEYHHEKIFIIHFIELTDGLIQ